MTREERMTTKEALDWIKMTRVEALDWIKARKEHYELDDNCQQLAEALNMAIQALEQEPCEDCISRSQALKEMEESAKHHANDSREEVLLRRDRDIIRTLPSVKPQEPKTGHWFVDERPESDGEIICSYCDQPIFKYHKLDFDYRPKYCPNCGAKMVEPQESED